MKLQVFYSIALVLLASCSAPPSGQDYPAIPLPQLAVQLDEAVPCSTVRPSAGKAVPLKMFLAQNVDFRLAPLATNDSERFVFKQIYETLTRVDCAGNLLPGLASDWEKMNGGRRWVLTLRLDAVFSDGTPVTARAVAKSWLRSARIDVRNPQPSPFQWLNVVNPGVRILDERHLQINLSEAMDDLPLLLAHQSLAICSYGVDDSHPLGSSPCHLDLEIAPNPGHLRLLPNTYHFEQPRWLYLDLLIQPNADASTIINGEVDLAIVRRQDLIAEFSVSRNHQVVHLPWDRMYLLLCPPTKTGTTTEQRQRWNTDWSSRELVAEVSVNLSTPLNQLTFVDPRNRICPLFKLPVKVMEWPLFSWPEMTTAYSTDLVLFVENDPEAAALGEFLAWHAGRPLRPAEDFPGRTALTPARRPAGRMVPQALGISPADFAGALQSGRAGAYILTMDRLWFSSCRQMAALVGLTTWLQDAAWDPAVSSHSIPESARPADPGADFDIPAAQEVAARLKRGRTVLPLTLSRACVIAGKSLRGFRTDHDGILIITDVSP